MANLEKEVELDFNAAANRIADTVKRTQLEYNEGLSLKYNAKIYLKREDLQVVRSYKLRGAYNMISTLTPEQLNQGVVCASAGNHAQGVAYSCKKLNIQGVIFMPEITPRQKIKQTEMFGGDNIKIVLVGDTFDDCMKEALIYTTTHQMVFIPPFDNAKIIEGQGTVGVEIFEDLPSTDVVIMPIGGGGLASGVGSYFKHVKPEISLIGVEPEGAPSMNQALKNGSPVTLEYIDRFVDGAAVKRVGNLTFEYCSELLDQMLLIPEGKICTTIASSL